MYVHLVHLLRYFFDLVGHLSRCTLISAVAQREHTHVHSGGGLMHLPALVTHDDGDQLS